ncbi:MAG: rod shape-determining protein MreC [Flavobacteriales bacterium]|nr:rod shape-determining protein MreC [Flavobacteriales bacterium]
MRNILLFIYRNHVFFLFLLLELLSFALIVRNNNFHRGSMLSSSNQMVGRVYELNNGISEYFHLKTVNQELALENAALRSLLQQSQYTYSEKHVDVVDSIRRQHYTYIPAKVINSTTDRRSNYLTINRGLLQGVEPEMAVISSNGIVGIVKDVSKNFASVISVLNKRSSISAKLADEGYIGSLTWDGRDPQMAQLMDIPNHVPMAEGMLVETSGYSSMFPSGIPIGKVRSFEVKDGDNFHSIEVELFTDMQSVEVVYVVNNLMRLEQTQLETESQTDDE